MKLKELVQKAPELPLGEEFQSMFDKQAEISYINTVFSPVNIRRLNLKILSNLADTYKLYIDNVKLKLTPTEFTPEKREAYLYKFNNNIAILVSQVIDMVRAANIGPDDIYDYYKTLLTEINLVDNYLFENNTLQTSMQYARHCNIMEQLYNNPEVSLRPAAFGDLPKDSFLMGGKILSPIYGELMSKAMWAITHNAMLAYNMLPKSVEADFDIYQKQVMETWLYIFKFLDFLGYDWDSIGRLYSVFYYSKTTKL